MSTICCWLNWGFGLIAGALLAKEVARRVKDVDLPPADRFRLLRLRDLARRPLAAPSLRRWAPRAGTGDPGCGVLRPHLLRPFSTR
ncbi:MAG: TIGR00366 family protein [Flavonifractor plautii]